VTSNGSLLSTLLALAAILLGLAIAVQVVQEMWKYVTSSRDKAYATVLQDFLGPFLSRQLHRPGVLRDLQVRGPFQFLWWRPSAKLLPMDADELVAALERTSSEWFQRAYAAMRLEGSLQRGVPAPPSASWQAFTRELEAAANAGTSAHAADIHRFLKAWQPSTSSSDAAGLLVAFHHQFLPQARKVGDHFDQLMRNYDFHYRRRNLRQTVVIALLLALLFDLPAGKLYRHAASLSPEAAVELAQAATDLQDEMEAAESSAGSVPRTPVDSVPERTPTDSVSVETPADTTCACPQAGSDTTVGSGIDTTLAALQGRLKRALSIAADNTDPFGQMTWPPVAWARFERDKWNGSKYLLQCLLTALLVCFGAPLLNDLTKALLRARTGGIRGVTTGEFVERTTITAPSAAPTRRI
jgi:hypothetical protein